MLNATIVFDENNQEQYFISKEFKSYSKCRITPKTFKNIIYDYQDIVIIPGPNLVHHEDTLRIISDCNKLRIKVIIQYNTEVNVVYSNVDLVIATSPQLYIHAKNRYSNIPVVFLPESIDTNNFQPSNIPEDIMARRNGIILGGTMDYKLNIPNILRPIYPAKNAITGLTQDNYKDFYTNIGCFITEGNNHRAILEAIACGVPVILIDKGNAHLLIQDEYIIPVGFKEETIKRLNTLVTKFNEDYELRDGIGKINRIWCEKIWAWGNNINLWDDTLYYFFRDEISQVIEISDSCMESFSKYFQPCDQYDEEIAHFAQLKEDHRIKKC